MIRAAWLAVAAAFAASDATADPERSFSIHAVRFRDSFNAAEVYVRQSAERDFGLFSLVYGLSVSNQASLWAGGGAALTLGRNGPIYFEASLMPGLYVQGNGPDLGYPLEFRSGIEAGYHIDFDSRVGVGIDHRSNNEFGDTNPGIDTLYVRFTLRR